MWLEIVLPQCAKSAAINLRIELLLYLANVLLFHLVLPIEQILIDISRVDHLAAYTTEIINFPQCYRHLLIYRSNYQFHVISFEILIIIYFII